MTLTLPLLIVTPMIIAIGMVAATVNSPHGLSASAFTTTSASTARRIIMIASMLTSEIRPTSGSIPPSHLAERFPAAEASRIGINPELRRPA